MTSTIKLPEPVVENDIVSENSTPNDISITVSKTNKDGSETFKTTVVNVTKK